METAETGGQLNELVLGWRERPATKRIKITMRQAKGELAMAMVSRRGELLTHLCLLKES